MGLLFWALWARGGKIAPKCPKIGKAAGKCPQEIKKEPKQTPKECFFVYFAGPFLESSSESLYETFLKGASLR